MVQVLPQKTNVGSQIGQALGMGLNRGMEQGIQRGLTNQGFDALLGQLGGSDPNLRNTIEVLRQGALNPSLDRSVAALAPLLLNRARTNDLYGQQARGGAAPLAPAEAARDASKFALGGEPGGFLAAPLNPEQVQQYAERYANVIGDPNAYDKGLAQAAQINQTREQSRASFEESAREMGVQPQELPRYLQMAKEFQYLKDPAEINRAAFQKYQRIKNLKDSLQNLVVPGTGSRLVEGAEGYPFSQGKAPKTREEYLKRFGNIARNLVNEGEEPEVRQTLSSRGLSPTEIEEMIHPLTKEKEQVLSGLPAGDKMNPKARRESLVNFFRKNVDNDTSLSVLRQYLVDKKKYDWKEIADAVGEAFPNGERLNQWQNAEQVNLNSPPKQSLEAIFYDFRNFLRGAK